MEVIGNIGISHEAEAIKIEWKIPDFFVLVGMERIDSFESPTFPFIYDMLYFKLFPSSMTYPGYQVLYLISKKCGRHSMEYNFGLKKLDGTVEKLVTGVLKEDESIFDPCIFQLSELQQQDFEIEFSGIVTIMCTLKHQNSDSTQEEPKHKKLRILNTLSDNFKELFMSKENSDTILHVRDKEYKTHRAVLIARSPVFAAMFLHDTLEKQTDAITIPDCDPDSFEQFLGFLYFGEVELTPHSALNLYKTSDKYNIEELKEYCRWYLMQSLTLKNFFNVIIFAYESDDNILLSGVKKFFSKNHAKILKSADWDCFAENNYFLSKELLTKLDDEKRC